MGRGTVNTPPPTDKTLSVKGMAADAYETGEKFSQLSSDIEKQTHAASDVTAGELGGAVTANAEAAADVTVAQVRNIVASETDPGAGTASDYADGTVLFVFE